MKAQEEEMRQNLEELVATQEEVQRKNQLIEEQKQDLEDSLEEEKKKVRELEEQHKSVLIQYNALQKTLSEVEAENETLQNNTTSTESIFEKSINKNT
jgi:predicted nuclease with TOPRIM domain